MADQTDKLLEAMSSIDASIKENSVETKECRRLATTAVSIADATRRNVQSFRNDVEAKLERIDDRVGSSERHIRRHDSGLREASNSDHSIKVDQAAQMIAVAETRAIALKALTKVEAIEKTGQQTFDMTKAQNPVLAQIQSDQKKPKTAGSITAAAIVNIVLGIIYLIREVLKHM